jgi:hypothetical protein
MSLALRSMASLHAERRHYGRCVVCPETEVMLTKTLNREGMGLGAKLHNPESF